MIRYYLPKKQALVYSFKKASPEYWDGLWKGNDFAAKLKKEDRIIVNTTKRYLRSGSRVLEGGCGRGNKVYSLHKSGFDAFGIDYAPQTIAFIKKEAPELKVCEGDVRDLPFEDGFFDGYWSLGVIEHFFEGYDDIANEMFRVLKPGGYLFLTFPCMNILRRAKARWGKYDPLPRSFDPDENNFYQYALDVGLVVSDLKKIGFQLKQKSGRNGIKGLKDEVAILKPSLQRIYDSRSFPIRIIKRLIDISFLWFCGNSALLVMRKSK